MTYDVRAGAKTLLSLAAASALVGCATVNTPTKGDPLEGFNRTMFSVNDKLDEVVLKPVAQGYVKVIPQPVRTSVANFFSNIGDFTVAGNDFLQGKITDGTEDVMRIAINSVFGIGGLFDVASQARLPKHNQDFGLTLGHYGVPAGPYLVLPLLGPSTVRDAAGFVADRFMDPSSYISPFWVSATLYGVHLVSDRAQLLGTTDLLAAAALDKYSFVRSAYLQRRQYLLSDGSSAAPNYGDESGARENSAPSAAPPPAPSGGGAGVGGTSGSETAPGASVPGGASAPAAASAASSAAGEPITTPTPTALPAIAPTPASGANPNGVPGQQMFPPANYFPSFHLR